MNRIRVLQVIPTLQCGGAERMVVNLMTHLDRRRFDAEAIVLARPDGGSLQRMLSKDGFRVSWLGKEGGFDPRVLLRIRKVVRACRPHVVHSHLCLHYVLPALTGHISSSRHVTTVHLPGDTRHAGVLLPLTRLALRRGVVPVAVSGEVAQWVQQACGAQHCRVIRNGVPVGDYRHRAAARTALRTEHGLGGDDIVFVCVARLEPQKNQAMLLEAFARAFITEPRAQLWLAGDGGCRDGLERRARELRVENRARFLGQRADVPQILAAADVFVLPSRNEGNPLALMEAMAAGLPVIGTAVGGVPELIASEDSGLLVRSGDCDGLASAMLRLFRDAELRHRMAARSAQHAFHSFTAPRMAQAYSELYERMVTRNAQFPAGRPFELSTSHLNQSNHSR
jgi:glycosyltransferase involved in cell wall biosynthesis